MDRRQRIRKYIKEYEWSNIRAMIRNGRKYPEICEERFEGKLVVITGATSGIGHVTARKYASMGANLFFINRNEQKSEKLKKEIESEFGVQCSYFISDLSFLKDSFEAADVLNKLEVPIDVLIHNAGVHLTKKEMTSEGLEKVFVVNYLSSFIMNFQLMQKLKSQEKARIILVNSEGHRFAIWGVRLDDLYWEKRRYSGLKSYGSAKTAQLLSLIRFNELFQNSGVTINAMHPGAVRSESGKDNGALYKWYKRNVLDRMLKPTDVSAEAIYFLGVSPKIFEVSGKFFNLTTEEEPTPPALDVEVAMELWDKTLAICGLKTI